MPCSSHLTKTKNVCLRCFRVLTLGMRPLALGGGIISLRHRVVLAPLTRLRASHDEMVPQAMCVRVARWFHVTNGRVSLGYSRSTLCVEPMSLMSNKYWAPIKLALFTHKLSQVLRIMSKGLPTVACSSLKPPTSAQSPVHIIRQDTHLQKAKAKWYILCCLVACYDVHLLDCQGAWHLD